MSVNSLSCRQSWYLAVFTYFTPKHTDFSTIFLMYINQSSLWYIYILVFFQAQLDQEKTLQCTSTISNSADIWFGQLIYLCIDFVWKDLGFDSPLLLNRFLWDFSWFSKNLTKSSWHSVSVSVNMTPLPNKYYWIEMEYLKSAATHSLRRKNPLIPYKDFQSLSL